MPNTFYCSFENTLADLKDCYDNLENQMDDNLSEKEKKARKELIILCVQIADDYKEEIK